MNIANKVWDSGWGAIFFTIYSIIIIHLSLPNAPPWINAAGVIPTVLIMFIAEYYNEELIDFFAGGELKRSTEEIQELTGTNHFYESAPEQVQIRVDKFDRLTYQQHISLLVGFVIAVTSPVIGYLLYDYAGLGGGLLLSLIALQGLSRRSIQELNTLAANITEPFQAKYEN